MPEHNIQNQSESAKTFNSQQKIFANLDRILSNQEKVDKVLSNQTTILANQDRILRNQEKLDTILNTNPSSLRIKNSGSSLPWKKCWKLSKDHQSIDFLCSYLTQD